MKHVIAYVHTHWDREWYREFEEFRLRLIEVVDCVVKNLEQNSLPCFYFDGQTGAIEDYLAIYPEKEPVIKELISRGKLFVGPFFCSGDSFLVSAQSYMKNLEIGIEKSKELGCTKFLGYLADTFGHSASIPTVLKYFDIKNAFLWRGLGELDAQFNWDGINAINLVQGYFHDYLSQNISYSEKASLIEAQLNKIAEKSSDVLLLPLGADHLSIPANVNEQIEQINKHLKNFKIELKSPFDFIERLPGRGAQKFSGELRNNSRNFILSGVYSSRIDLKQQNAKLQWDLQAITEPLQAFAYSIGVSKSYQNEIDYAYKQLMKNHAHDSIYGCSTDGVHREMKTRFEKVAQITNGIKKRVIRDLKNDSDKISVFNLGGFDYQGAVEIITDKNAAELALKGINWAQNVQLIDTFKGFSDEKLYNINEIPVTEDFKTLRKYLIDVKNINPYTLKTLEDKDFETNKYLKVRNNSIENKNVMLEVKNCKIIIHDKINNHRYDDFIEIIDRADIGDSYNFGALRDDKPLRAKIKKVSVLESGAIRAKLRIFFEIAIPVNSTSKGRSKKSILNKLTLDAVLYNSSEYIEFEANWINKSKNHILQLVFNLPNPINHTLSEDMLGVVERKFDPDYDIYSNLVAAKKRGVELKTNTAAMQRFVSAQGVGLMTKGNHEYEIFQQELRLTMLRATGMISNPQNSTRSTPAGPPIACDDLQMPGKNHANFALCFSDEIEQIYKHTQNFYNPCVAFLAEGYDETFIEPKKNTQTIFIRTNTENGLTQTFYDKQEGTIFTK